MDNLLSTLSTIAVVTLIYMTLWFILAVTFRRRDVVDSAWGLGFIAIAITAFSQQYHASIFAAVTLGLVTLWGFRLFVHITSRNWKKKEDYRYAELGELTSARFWLKTYTNVFLLQGLLMIVISLPVIAIMSSSIQPLSWLAKIGAIVWLFGIVFEAVGDYQLQRFIRTGKKGIMQSGLWRYTRHPNYFGEISAWWGAAIIALAYGQWWGIIGAATITILITKISGIPLLEKRYANDKTYQRYARVTSKLIPWPPRQS